jgi:protein-L-isoaspartate(D-aspartate) O-methyltransferase
VSSPDNQADHIENYTKRDHAISVKSVSILSVGILAGFIFGLVVPGNLPGGSEHEAAFLGASPTYARLISGNYANTAHAEIESGERSEYDVLSHYGTTPLDDVETYVAFMLAQTDETEEHLRARWDLSRLFIDTGELQGKYTIEGFLRTPREHFVRESNLERAYDDTWLPIGYGATITDPDVVAMMTTTLDLGPHHKVLEIGTGSGYQSAILSNISNDVYSIEIIEPLYYETNALYDELSEKYPNFTNINRKLGDGYYGWEKYAPFDRIIVTCSIDHLPPPLIKQLAPDGIMVVPLGPPGRQYIMEVKKHVDESGNADLSRRDVYNGLSVKFIPFRDEAGKSYSN